MESWKQSAAVAVVVAAAIVIGGGLQVWSLQHAPNEASGTPLTTAGPTTTPSAPQMSPSATPTPATKTIDVNGRAVPFYTAQVLPPLTAPRSLSLVVTHGCAWCDVPDQTIERVSWDGAGTVRTETLFSAQREGGSYITGIAATPDGGVIVAGVCVRSYCGPMGSTFYSDAMVKLFRSMDGGVTWAELATVNGYAFPLGIASDGQAIVFRVDSTTNGYVAKLPSGERFATPVAAADSDWPQVLGSEPWWDPGRGRTLVSPSRTWTLDIPVGSGSPRVFWWGKEGAVYQWFDRNAPGAKSYIGDAYVGGELRAAWEVAAYDLTLRTWPHQTRLLANASFDGNRELPVLIGHEADPNELTIQAIDVPAFPPNDRNKVVAGMIGFVRVTGTGDCLRVRSAPSTSANELGCYKDGVLLWDAQQTVDADGRTWMKVLTPTPPNDWVGQEGWAASEYLER